VTHFLLEARNAGYGVPPRRLEASLDYLASLRGAGERGDDYLPEKAYAAYVLALAGMPRESWCRRLHELREELPIYSQFHLAGAMALMHRRDGLESLVDLKSLPSLDGQRQTGGCLDSPLRRAAILLSIYLDVAPDHRNVVPLVAQIGRALKARQRRSTQETAFALLAMGKYARHLRSEKIEYDGQISVDDEDAVSFTEKEETVLRPEGAERRSVTVRLSGTGKAYCYWTREGIPVGQTLPAVDRGIGVRRRYLNRDGEEVPLAMIRQGQLLVVELTVVARDAIENVVISDLLPAGLEIENPVLQTRARDVPALPAPAVSSGLMDLFSPDDGAASRERACELHPENVQMRDDRLLVFTDLPSGEPRYYRYVVRAVTVGTFALPAVSARCMYDPARESRYGAGHVRIVRGW
jgi:hypothetical protein